ncbi:hypothetical protein T265_08725 [Opisthorchis viverrini]|uniref:Reverse transcriptase domain-containing protein n=1 Tax=Opisthorchis viverrini TaxID=6198 RepID=A0A074ZJ71_OPIVI|nr:hypothetical protein T265_08725 [Opisthorchis viverrini]KER23400.1 hypothetical protein T265_08725 [Opisthorchis viverrini]
MSRVWVPRVVENPMVVVNTCTIRSTLTQPADLPERTEPRADVASNVCRTIIAYFFTGRRSRGGERCTRFTVSGLDCVSRAGTSAPKSTVKSATNIHIDIESCRENPMTTENVVLSACSSGPPKPCPIEKRLARFKVQPSAKTWLSGVLQIVIPLDGAMQCASNLAGLYRRTLPVPDNWGESMVMPIYKKDLIPFRSLAALPPEGSTRAAILPSCLSLDRENREAEVAFKPITFCLMVTRENLTHEDQPGIRQGRGYVEHNLILRHMHGRPTILVFLSFKDAFGSVVRPAIELYLLNRPLTDKNKTNPGNLGKSLDPVCQSVNPCRSNKGSLKKRNRSSLNH